MADENIGATPPDGGALSGQVRILVGDTTPRPLETPEEGLGQYAWYSDDELETLGSLFNNNPKKVAIWVLSQVGMSQALLLKKWKSEDLDVDGPAIIRGIEATLKRLSAEVERDEFASGDDEFFEIYGGSGSGGVRVAYPPEIGIGWWSTY